MDSDPTMQLLTMRSAQTHGAAQIAVLKKQHEMEMSLVQMLSEAAQAPPPKGQGLVIDKTA